MSFLATTSGVSGEDVRDLMLAAVQHRFGLGSGEEVVPASDYRALQSQVRELQRLLGKKTLEAEILKEADNGSCYVAAGERGSSQGMTPRDNQKGSSVRVQAARRDTQLRSRHRPRTPIESPQSNGMAEAFARTIKRDYVRVRPGRIAQRPHWS
jgi:hypothetical protein